METQEFNILLLGDHRVGKSTFIHRLTGRPFEDKYIHTRRSEIHSMVRTIENREMKIILRDSLEDLRQYPHVDGIIIMFDIMDWSSYNSVKVHYRMGRNIWEDIPIVIVGNKCDGTYMRIKPVHVGSLASKLSAKWCVISAKTGYCIDKPLEILTQR